MEQTLPNLSALSIDAPKRKEGDRESDPIVLSSDEPAPLPAPKPASLPKRQRVPALKLWAGSPPERLPGKGGDQGLSFEQGYELWKKGACFQASPKWCSYYEDGVDAVWILVRPLATKLNSAPDSGTHNAYFNVDENNETRKLWQMLVDAAPPGSVASGKAGARLSKELYLPSDGDYEHQARESWEECWNTLKAATESLGPIVLGAAFAPGRATPAIAPNSAHGGTYVMERGTQLGKWIGTPRRDIWEAELMGGQLHLALARAARAGLMMVDIKPANIIVMEPAMEVRFIDFGSDFTRTILLDGGVEPRGMDEMTLEERKEWLDCIYLVNATLLLIVSQCFYDTTRMRELLQQVVERVGELLNNAPLNADSKTIPMLCHLLSTLHVSDEKILPENTTLVRSSSWRRLARHILHTAKHYSQFDDKNSSCYDPTIDPNQPLIPQLRARALKDLS